MHRIRFAIWFFLSILLGVLGTLPLSAIAEDESPSNEWFIVNIETEISSGFGYIAQTPAADALCMVVLQPYQLDFSVAMKKSTGIERISGYILTTHALGQNRKDQTLALKSVLRDGVWHVEPRPASPAPFQQHCAALVNTLPPEVRRQFSGMLGVTFPGYGEEGTAPRQQNAATYEET